MAMPTLQQIIGTITGKVAFERTQANFNTIKDAHNGLDTSLTSHKAESVQQVFTATRDMSLTGVQTISTTPSRQIRGITIYGVVNFTKAICIGYYTPNEQGSIIQLPTDQIWWKVTEAVKLSESNTTNAFTGTIQNVNLNGFDINWEISGTIAGTATLMFIVDYHD